MRLRLRVMLSIAIALTCPASAHAAEESGAVDDASAAETNSDASGIDGGMMSANVAVIACDGDLCDTLQGRPTCAVAERSLGSHSGATADWFVGAALALCLGLVRRARCGAPRPIPEGSTRWNVPPL